MRTPNNQLCTLDWCSRPRNANGLCLLHYRRSSNGYPMEPSTCKVPKCDEVLKISNTSGLCGTHNYYFKSCAHLDPLFDSRCITCGAELRRNNQKEYCDDCLPRSLGHSLWPEKNHQERVAQWKRENRDKVRQQVDRRRALKLDAFIEDVDRPSIWCRDSGLCFLCGFPADKDDWHLAHIVPLARGGDHSYANTTVSHPDCNYYQNDRLLEELDIEAFLIFREEQFDGRA